jgi:hypothetical protein
LNNTAVFDDTASYAVLYEGSANHNLQINSSPFNGSTILGNVGLGNENGGDPTAQLNNPAVINGNVNFAGAVNGPGNAVINGSVNGHVGQVDTDLNILNSLSSALGAEGGAGLTISGSQTINATSGNLDSFGNYVFNLTSMNLANGNTLVINGDNLGDSVVINLSTVNINNPHFAGAIVLEGGLTANQVLFNIIGGNTLTLTGGATLQTSANNATQDCTYLDPDGTININSVNIEGHVFGGDSTDMQIVSGATVHAPPTAPVPEASTIISGALMLVPLGIGALRALRRNRAAVK